MAWLIMVGIIALPVAEIMVWIKVAESIGALATIGLTVLSVMVGSAILRRQGLAMLLDARARLELGETPLAAAFDGLCLAAAGILLILPGFITDALAGLLLLPPVRALLLRWMASRLVMSGPGSGPADPTVIEAEYHVVDTGEAPPDHKRLEP